MLAAEGESVNKYGNQRPKIRNWGRGVVQQIHWRYDVIVGRCAVVGWNTTRIIFGGRG